MSKNYRNYSKQPEQPVVEAVEEPVVQEPVTEVEVTPVTGIVSDCSRLNVRRSPVPTAAVVGIVDRGASVQIDEEKSTAEFYKVCTASGVEGFCMKKFITVKQ